MELFAESSVTSLGDVLMLIEYFVTRTARQFAAADIRNHAGAIGVKLINKILKLHFGMLAS